MQWITIFEPNPTGDAPNAVFEEGFASGAAEFNRLEGCWDGSGSIFFASTSGGDAKNGDVNSDGFEEGYGQTWEYVPRGASGGQLVLLYESPDGEVLDSPDNIVVSPRGGLVLCEDDSSGANLNQEDESEFFGEDENRLVGLTLQGTAFPFAENIVNDSELAGARWSDEGEAAGLPAPLVGSPRSMTTWRRAGSAAPRREPRVVVVTGASSGIGRVTAHAFAARGARLVLAARSGTSLQDVAQECRERGGQALVVPTDVGSEQQVHDLVRAAVEEFGRIDVWVGGASVFSYGTFEQTPPEVFRQVLETNFFGQVHGARAVLPVFRAQGGGVLVLVASLYSKVTSPYLSPYITSKWALLALAEVLRQELRDTDGVEVCAVLPATVDTPIYQHAANATGRRPHPLPPVVDPRRVARAIVRVSERPRRVTVVGQVQRAAVVAHAVAPRLYERAVGPTMDLLALRDGPVADAPGTVFAPQPDSNRIDGGWRRSRWTSVPAAVALAAAAVVGARRARR